MMKARLVNSDSDVPVAPAPITTGQNRGYETRILQTRKQNNLHYHSTGSYINDNSLEDNSLRQSLGPASSNFSEPLQNFPMNGANSSQSSLLWKAELNRRVTMQSLLTRSTRGGGPTLTERCFAEVFGTFVLVMFGSGVSFAENLEYASSNVTQASPTIQVMSWWMGVLAGVCLTEHISGAHLNPIVTFSMYLSHRLGYLKHNAFTAKEVILYSISQLLGAFLASAALFTMFYHQFHHEWNKRTSGLFVTFPTEHTSHAQALFGETLSTCLLIIGLFAMIEPINGISQVTVAKGASIGALVFVLIACFQGVAGPSMNPARDMGPRIFCALAGWGTEAFSQYEWYFWIPSVGPLIGSTIGTIVYHSYIHPAFHYEKYYSDNAQFEFRRRSRYHDFIGGAQTVQKQS